MHTRVFSNDNPSALYWEALKTLMTEGAECAPRGKKIKEIRPVIFEFTNPLRRVTFLRGRLINPFFQLAESLWIIAGYSELSKLIPFNSSFGQFSDNGKHFNAPYGERLRYWNKNDMRGFVFNPMDQLTDVYNKIKADPDTRQAVAVIYNPMFDNFGYKGKDTPCNLVLLFKQRDGKLYLNVFNRSNDIHWGVFGANIVQFSTILELMASWLGVEVGTYYQNTDSLHVYMDDYGYKITDAMVQNQLSTPDGVHDFQFPEAARIKWGKEDTGNHLWSSVQSLYNSIISDGCVDAAYDELASSIWGVSDPYFRDILLSMLAYRIYKTQPGYIGRIVDVLGAMSNSEWKAYCTRFIYPKYKDDKLFNMRLIDDTWADEALKAFIRREGEKFHE